MLKQKYLFLLISISLLALGRQVAFAYLNDTDKRTINIKIREIVAAVNASDVQSIEMLMPLMFNLLKIF
jgi:hypothetical protein